MSVRKIGNLGGRMMALAVVIGLLGGYGAVGFRHLIDFLHGVWPGNAADIAWYWVVGLPAAGGFVAASLTHWFAPEAQGHGVPEVMEAVALRNGRIRPRVVAIKALASSATIASGGSVGREGPIVQIGAAIGSAVGQLLRLNARQTRTLLGCGAAAGIAATFNAPVAGALFAVEILLGDFAARRLSPIIVSSVVATIVGRAYLGDVPAFEIPVDQLAAYRLVHVVELVPYAILGLLAGLVAFGFVRLLCAAEDGFEALPLPLPVLGVIGGTMVGGIACVFPDVLGVGYEAINRALAAPESIGFLAALLVAKLVATCITLGSGGSGGVFAPSLMLGAMLGGCVGLLVNRVMPGLSAPAGAYALVGMGSVVAAATRAPITTILIVFELTSDYRIMLPLMISCIVGTLFNQRLSKESIYTIKLARRGIRVRSGQEINVLRHIPLGELIRPPDRIVRPDEGVAALAARFVEELYPFAYVAAADGHYYGVISMNELRPVLGETGELDAIIRAVDIAATDGVVLGEDQRLDAVLEVLDREYHDELPVVTDGVLRGVVRVSDLIARYRVEIAKRELQELEAEEI